MQRSFGSAVRPPNLPADHSAEQPDHCDINPSDYMAPSGRIAESLLPKFPVENELPVAIFGGDFDCTSEQWLLCLKKEEATQASMRNVQVAGGTVLNDRVAVFNAFAAQEDSGWKSRSDHDVVLVPLCWRLHTPAKTARPVVPKVTAAHTGPWPRRSNTANGPA